jgi:hypothetical protein
MTRLTSGGILALSRLYLVGGIKSFDTTVLLEHWTSPWCKYKYDILGGFHRLGGCNISEHVVQYIEQRKETA